MNGIKKTLSAAAAICLSVTMVTGCQSKIADKLREDIKETTTEVTEGATSPETEIRNNLNLGVVNFDTLNPLLTHSETVKECLEFIYEPLFDLDEQHRIVPALADSYTVSADGRVIDIVLKSGVTWHDGSPFTARDVAYTFKQIKAGLTNYTENLSNAVDYRGIDNDKVQITLAYAVPDFVMLLNFPIVKYGADMSGASDFVPMGTGPFSYASKPNVNKILLGANDTYYGGRANIDTIEVSLVPDEKKYETMFEASEIDVITGDAVDLTEYTPRGSAKNYQFVTDKMTFLGFNTSKSKLSGAETRVGLSKLVDKSGIVESTIYSRGTAVDIPINPKSIYYYDTNTKFRKNETEALTHLGNDGWGTNDDGDYVRNKNGQKEKLSFDLICENESGEREAVAKRIADEMTEFGIPVSVDSLKRDEFISRITSGDYDMMISEIELSPNGDLSPLISSSGNYLFYKNSNLDTLVGQMGLTFDTEQLKELYKQYGEEILKEMPFCPIYFGRGDLVAGAKIKNELLPSVTRHFRNVNTWRIK